MTRGATPTCYDRLKVIVTEVASESAFTQWLNAKNAVAGGKKPLDLIIDGKCEEAMELAYIYVEMKREQ